MNATKPSVDQVIDAIQHKWFATHDSLESCAEYVQQLAKASNDPSAVTVAVQVYANTIAAVLRGEATIGK